MLIIKADGSKEEFDPKKIFKTCIRAGAPRDTADAVAKKISQSVRENWTTHRIYKLIVSELDKVKNKSSFIVTIRHAIAKLGPENFELFTKKLLEAEGYKCEWNRLIKGRSVEHQIDITAKKEKLYLVECKHHTNPHRFCGLGIVLQVYARMEDVNDGFKDGRNKYNFDNAWVVTNTKFSYHAKKYAEAKRILLTGWGYKGEYALEKMSETKKIYPITIIRTDPATEKRILENGIVTLDDFLVNDAIKAKLKKGVYVNIFNQIKHLLE